VTLLCNEEELWSRVIPNIFSYEKILLRKFSIPGDEPLEAEPGAIVVCVVPYKEWATGFDADLLIQVLTTRGWLRATVLRDTQVSYFYSVSQEVAQEAGYASGIEAAEQCGKGAGDIAATVRFRIHETTEEETTWQKIRRVTGL
tara:strand:- start:88 stop:519 length:432 start_codon:yes stop_codon:yes gene_type:complete